MMSGCDLLDPLPRVLSFHHSRRSTVVMQKHNSKVSKKSSNAVGNVVVDKVAGELKMIREFYDAAKKKEAGRKGFDDAVDKLIIDLFDNPKVSASVASKAGKTVMEGATALVEMNSEFGKTFTGRAFQIGVVDLLMKSRLTETVKGRPSTAKHKAWRNVIIESYVKDKLGLPADKPLPTKPAALKEKCDKLWASKLRQLQKYVNLAECGESILDLGYGGIDAALQGRWLILDMIALQGAVGTKVKLNPELAKAALQAIQAEYPAPTELELAGKSAEKEIRLWVDSVATIFQLQHAEIDKEFMDYNMAHEFASATGRSLHPNMARKAYVAVKDIPEENRKKELGQFLNNAAEAVRKGAANMVPSRVADYFTKFKLWADEIALTDEVLAELRDIEAIKDSIGPVYEAISKIKASIVVTTPAGQE